ncbi:MAG: rRNA maturation RNase YbeY [Lachnospiraceae bacterium]|nr:rRNA maturation RNase YbeY [Lachnospiraceae bacterium]
MVFIEKETDIELRCDAEKVIERVVDQSLAEEGFPQDMEVNVLLTDDDSIHEINLSEREIDAATDVLSFPMIEYEVPGDTAALEEADIDPETDEMILGDIVISLEHVIAQAEEYNHSHRRELAFLTAHSMLHLMGYDHMTDEMRADMEERQEKILAACGIPRDDEEMLQ